MTALGTVIPRAWTLYIERMKVVPAKEKRPLCKLSLVSELDVSEAARGNAHRGPGLPMTLNWDAVL